MPGILAAFPGADRSWYRGYQDALVCRLTAFRLPAFGYC